jgi:hypothetical protein
MKLANNFLSLTQPMYVSLGFFLLINHSTALSENCETVQTKTNEDKKKV